MRHALRTACIAAGVLIAGALTVPGSSPAAELRAAPHTGYGRIVFDYDSPVTYMADMDGSTLRLRFSEPVPGQPGSLPAALADYVSAVSLSADRTEATLTLKGDVTLKTFTLGTAIVVDLVRGDGQATSAPAQTPPAPAEPARVTPPSQAAAPRLPVRTASHPGYQRMVFDWARDTPYKVEQSGNQAVISFSRPGAVDIAALRQALPEPLKKVATAQTAGGLSVTVPVPDGSRVRHFTSGPKVVLDVLLPEAAVQAAAEQARADAAGRPPEVAALTPVRPQTPENTAPESTAPESLEVVPAPAPPVPAPASPVPETAQLPGPAPVAVPETAPEAASQPVPDVPSAAAPVVAEPVLNDPLVPALPTAIASLPDETTAEDGAPERRARVVSLSFPWNQPAAAAVFERAGYTWIVFDRLVEVDLDLLRKSGLGVVRYVEQQSSRSATILRLILEPGYHPSVRREGLLWIIDLMRQPYRPARPVEVLPQPKSPVGPRLYLPVSEGGRAMVVEDPEVGDRFMIVPVVPLGAGVYPGRAFPDAVLPVTVQGVVVEPRSDRIVVNSSRNGIDVTAQGGLTLSAEVAQAAISGDGGMGADLTRAFDIPAWLRGPAEEFNDNRKALQASVASTPRDRRNTARIDLARFFFAHGRAAEALGILRVISSEQPDLEATPAFRALRGAANLLMGRNEDAVTDLSHPSLAGVDEAQFWRAAAQSRLGDPALQAKALANSGGVMQDYPRWVKVPLALTAATATVAAADDLATETFLGAARRDDNTLHEKAAITYIEGLIAQASGNYEAALDAWARVGDSTDRYYRALAIRDRLELLFRIDQMDRSNLIKGLERLRFAWRGGNFEFDLLMRLGDLYSEAGDYGKALRVWQQAATYFKDREGAKTATRRMQETFERLYYDGMADSLSPITAIALYDEFRELTPSGPRGDDMIRRLADRLVAVDLLPQAAMLLDRQIKYRLTGAEKARVGARLALVQLLDQRPSQAVEALLQSKSEDAPRGLERQRNQLLSRSLADIGRTDEALDLLAGDDSRNAEGLRAEINWRARNWAAAATSLANLVPEPSRQLILTGTQAQMVLDLATAMTLAKDERGVAALRARYGAAMVATPYRDAFDLLTSPVEGGLIDYRTVADRIKQVENFQTFLGGYRDQLKSDGLSAIN